MRTNRNVTKLRHDIKDALLQLRMSPLEQELEKQYDQPQWEQLGFERRLAEALQNVCDQRNSKNFQKLMQNACISPDVELADFDDFWLTPARKDYSSLIEQLRSCEWLIKEKPANLVIVGPTGSGKSWLASAFAREACRLNLKVQFIGSTKRLLEELNRYKLEDYNRFFNKIVKANLLILDDFLLEVPTEQECRWLHEIIQNRYQKRATIILSQKPMQTWPQILPQGAATDAVVDRLVHFSHYFQLKEEKSLRTFID